MDTLILWLDDAMHGSSLLALGAATLWGVVSVLLSPCHLGTIPLVVAYVGTAEAGEQTSKKHAAALSFSFAGGMLVAVAVLGGLMTALGWAVAGIGHYTNYGIALVFVLAGLNLVGVLPMPQSGLSIAHSKRKGPLAAAVLGLVFGVGLSPCTFAFLAPVLAVSFGTAGTAPAFGLVLLVAFGVGHCGVIGLAGTSAGFIQNYLDWNDRSSGLNVMKAVCGVLLLASASVLVYTA